MKIKKGDTVQVLIGKNRGKRGVVEKVLPKTNQVVVAGVNIVTRHMKPRQGMKQAGKIEMVKPIHASNVALVDSKTGKYTKVSVMRTKTGERERISRTTRDAI